MFPAAKPSHRYEHQCWQSEYYPGLDGYVHFYIFNASRRVYNSCVATAAKAAENDPNRLWVTLWRILEQMRD